MASIHASGPQRVSGRYDVRYRDGQARQRSRSFSARKDAQAFKLDVERKRQAGILYQAAPERSPHPLVLGWSGTRSGQSDAYDRGRVRSQLAEDALKGPRSSQKTFRSSGSIGRSSRT